MALSKVEQHLLNYFELVNISLLKSALEIFAQILEQLNVDISPNEDELSKGISHINKTIQNYDLEIIESVDEITFEKLLILINISDNIVTQKSKFYDENTKQIFSKIIKECVISKEGYISETHILNLSSQIPLSKSAAQFAIETLIKDNWLKLHNGSVILSMRSIAELEQNIKQLYPDEVKHCPFCQLFIVQGFICANCQIRCHYGCLKKYILHAKSNYECPKCKEVWNDIPSHSNIEEKSYQVKGSTLNNIPVKKKKPSK